MSEIKPRITGTEMEWPISYIPHGKKSYEQYTPTSQLVEAVAGDSIVVVENPRPSATDAYTFKKEPNGMASNGSRIYIDQQRLEYATPEDASFMGTVTNELASERLVIEGLARFMRGGFNTKNLFDTDHAFITKRVTDGHSSWGYHMNFSASMHEFARLSGGTLSLLGLHIATSQMMLGAGAIVQDGRGDSHYSLSQKTSTVAKDEDHTTTLVSSKPLINTRNQASDANKMETRIHVTSMDPHVSPWAGWMALGTNSLVLRAIEQKRHKTLYAENTPDNNPLSFMARRGGYDLTGERKYPMKHRGLMSAVDIQHEIIDLVSKTDHTDEEHKVLKEWERAIADAEKDYMLLHDRSDAIAKLGLLRAYAQKHNIYKNDHVDYGDPRLRQLDIKSTTLVDLSPNNLEQNKIAPLDLHKKTIANRMRSTVFADKMPDEDSIHHAKTNPPENTRAYRRGRAIGWKSVKVAGWDGYAQNDGRMVQLGDPHDTEFYKKRDRWGNR